MERKRRQGISAAEKLEVVAYAKKVSIKAASKKFNADRTSIRDWKNNESAIRQQM